MSNTIDNPYIDDAELLAVGKISSLHGVHGAFNIRVTNAITLAALCDIKLWYWRVHCVWEPMPVATRRCTPKNIIATLTHCHTRELAMRYCGLPIAVARTELAQHSTDLAAPARLLGFAVMDINYDSVGTVIDIYTTMQDLLVIAANDSTKNYLVPLVQPDVIQDIDMQKRTVLLNWPLDWLE